MVTKPFGLYAKLFKNLLEAYKFLRKFSFAAQILYMKLTPGVQLTDCVSWEKNLSLIERGIFIDICQFTRQNIPIKSWAKGASNGKSYKEIDPRWENMVAQMAEQILGSPIRILTNIQ